jgi:DNA-binding response OmpR family regulator
MTQKGLWILVVDDDNQIFKGLDRVLRSPDYTLLHASNMKVAIASVKNIVFDVILMDYDLPGTTGCRITQAIRDCGVKTPILGHTGNKDAIHEFHNIGVERVLEKPIAPKEIIEILKKIL